MECASGVRLAELLASLSFATDLGRGLPMEHSIRRALLALRLADHLAYDFSDRRERIWPNVSSKRLEVHAEGDHSADVTEGSMAAGVW